MISEAITVLTELKTTLVSTYGNDILTLFPTKVTETNSTTQSGGKYENKRSAYSKNVDVEIEQMITDAGGTENILDPGLQLFSMANVTDSPSKGDDSTMDLQSVDKSAMTARSILRNAGAVDSAVDSDDSMSAASGVSSLAQSERSMRFSLEVNKQEIKSEEGKQKKISELLAKYKITQENYDTKASNDPAMIRSAKLFCYKKRTPS